MRRCRPRAYYALRGTRGALARANSPPRPSCLRLDTNVCTNRSAILHDSKSARPRRGSGCCTALELLPVNNASIDDTSFYPWCLSPNLASPPLPSRPFTKKTHVKSFRLTHTTVLVDGNLLVVGAGSTACLDKFSSLLQHFDLAALVAHGLHHNEHNSINASTLALQYPYSPSLIHGHIDTYSWLFDEIRSSDDVARTNRDCGLSDANVGPESPSSLAPMLDSAVTRTSAGLAANRLKNTVNGSTRGQEPG